ELSMQYNPMQGFTIQQQIEKTANRVGLQVPTNNSEADIS
ncbi:14210_t:CDS:1, partial [Acaulospora colombiana]